MNACVHLVTEFTLPTKAETVEMPERSPENTKIFTTYQDVCPRPSYET